VIPRMGLRLVWPLAIAAGLIALMSGAQPANLVGRGAAFALALASLVVLTGWSGQLNLHVAAIGLGWGAYAAAGLAANGVPSLVAILVAPLVVAPAALVVGVVAVRFRGLELAIATLAAGLAFEQMAFQNLGRWLSPASAGTQFESSLIEIARPAGFTGDRPYALLALAVAGVWLLVSMLAGRGTPGRILRAIRDREVVAEARGVPVFAWRVGAFVLAIAVAAAGGALFAGQTGAVTPGSFSLALSLQMLAVSWVSGIRRLEAAVIGATILIIVQEAAGISWLSWLSGDRADLIFGVGLIAALAVQVRRRATDASLRGSASGPVLEAAVVPVPSPDGFRPTMLRLSELRVSFGGLHVLDGIEMRVGAGEICGLVGDNGAGKTTLFNCVTGLMVPDDGRVFFRDIDITELAPHRRAELGLARTFQGVEIFEGLTVREGLMVAQGLRTTEGDESADHALAEIGIEHLADADPTNLPLATLRLVELASTLITDPALILLDEPLAGLDAAERAVVLAAIGRMRGDGRSVLIVEHDRASVAQIADRIYELADGRVRETAGPPMKRRARVAARS
jgi:branched-chain amino acid transport system ATP-binding protein/branched-chain amino acid transport system permease protein